MKTKLFLITLFLLMLGAISLQAQPVVKDAISVNGLKIGTKYTQNVIFQALGTPTEIIVPQEYDETPANFLYLYGRDRFEFTNGEFCNFHIVTGAFAVNGVLRVGALTSAINQLGGIKEPDSVNMLVRWRPSTYGIYGCTYLEVEYNKVGKVISLEGIIYDL